MAKTEKTATTKQPKTVQVKLLVPYWILVTLFTVAVGFVSGWHTQQSYNQSMEQSYKNGVASVKEQSPKE